MKHVGIGLFLNVYVWQLLTRSQKSVVHFAAEADHWGHLCIKQGAMSHCVVLLLTERVCRDHRPVLGGRKTQMAPGEIFISCCEATLLQWIGFLESSRGFDGLQPILRNRGPEICETCHGCHSPIWELVGHSAAQRIAKKTCILQAEKSLGQLSFASQEVCNWCASLSHQQLISLLQLGCKELFDDSCRSAIPCQFEERRHMLYTVCSFVHVYVFLRKCVCTYMIDR